MYSKVEKEYGGNGFVSKIIKTDYAKPLGRVIEDPASKQSEEDPPNEVLEEKTITYYTNKEVALEEHFENERLISKVEYKYSTLKPKE